VNGNGRLRMMPFPATNANTRGRHYYVLEMIRLAWRWYDQTLEKQGRWPLPCSALPPAIRGLGASTQSSDTPCLDTTLQTCLPSAWPTTPNCRIAELQDNFEFGKHFVLSGLYAVHADFKAGVTPFTWRTTTISLPAHGSGFTLS